MKRLSQGSPKPLFLVRIQAALPFSFMINAAFLVIITFGLTLIVFGLPLSLSPLKTFSEIVQAIGIGVGAFLGGLGGLSIFKDLLEKIKKQRKIDQLRNRYNNANLDNKFHLVWFSGTLFLFDEFNQDDKKFFHVRPWDTAEDLDLVSYGVKVQDKFPNPLTPIVKLDGGKELDTTKYRNCGTINTQK